MSALRPTPPAPVPPQEVAEIPIGVRRMAAWSWRLLVIAAALALLVWALGHVTTLFIPVLLAVLLTVMLQPVVRILTRYTFLGRGAASGVALLGLILVIAGMFTLAGRQLIAQLSDIQEKAISGFQAVTEWVTSTFRIDDTMVNSAIDQGLAQLEANADALLDSALNTASVVGNLATGIVICLFTLFFLLSSGPRIWLWVIGLLPPDARTVTHESFRRGWKALSAYVRTQILVAAVDATGIAIGMLALGLGSYAVPIWLLVFLFSFVPLVGAILSGAIAILLVLVLQNWVYAVIMFAVVLAVQQLESNILQPFLMGKAVQLHPLAVFLGVAAGVMVAGIPGALFAIPLIAFVNPTVLYLVGRDPSPDLGTDPVARAHREQLRRGSRSARTAASAPPPVPATTEVPAGATPTAATPDPAAPTVATPTAAAPDPAPEAGRPEGTPPAPGTV